MPGLLYTLPDDDYVPGICGTSPNGISANQTALADYEVEQLGNEDPMWPFKTAATSVDIDLDFGAAVPIGLVAILHANLTAGGSPGVLSVLLDDHAGFSSPETFLVDVPSYQEDGFPTTPFYDFVAEGDGVKTYRYLRVRIVGNSVPITIGGLVVYPGWRDLGVHFQVGGSAIDDEDHPSVKNPTDAGANQKYPQGYRIRRVSGDVLETNEEDDEQIRRWNRAALGDVRPFLIDPNLPIVEPWYVTFAESRLPRKRLFRVEETGATIQGYSLVFSEVPRGLKPDPSAV